MATGDREYLTRPPVAAGLVLALVVPPLLVRSGLVEGELVADAIKWGIAGTLLVLVVGVEAAPLASIGFVRPRFVDIGWALLLTVAAVAAFVVTDPLVEALGLPTVRGIPQPSVAVGVLSAVTAGITEEVMYRGYPIEKLVDAGFGPLAAGGATWALFTLAHVGAGYPAGNLVQIALAALVITAVYVRVRSLFPVILGHVAVDLIGVWAYFYA